MGRYVRTTSSLVVVCVVATIMSFVSGEAQEQTKPSFEVISIKPGPTNTQEIDYKFLPGGRFKGVHVTLDLLIAKAYGVDLRLIENIPKSIGKANWDIEARPEDGKYSLKNGLLDSNVARQMVQSMLEDRFKLKMHKEERLVPGYELVIGKGGAKITPSKKDSKTHGGSIMPGYINSHSVSLSQFASQLITHFTLWEGKEGRSQVADKTGLEGLYDIRLRWTPARPPIGFQSNKGDDPETSIFDAIEDQLGLKLAPAKVPTSVMVVDAVQNPVTN